MAEIKYLSLEGLKSFWGKVKTYIDTQDALKVDKTTKVNGHALSGNITLGGADIVVGGEGTNKSETVAVAIKNLENAIAAADAKAGVQSFGGKTGVITVDAAADATAGDGKVKFAMSGNTLTATVDLSSKADKATTINGKPLSDNVSLAGADITVGGTGTYAANNIQTAIEGLDTAVKAEAAKVHVDSLGGKTGAITLKAKSSTNGDINLAISEGKEMSASIVGLGSAAYTESSAYAAASHNHAISEVTDLQTNLNAKATKAVALKNVTAAATANESNVTVTFSQTTEADSTTSSNNFTLPVAGETSQGTTTLEQIKTLARKEATTVAGSTYRVKGTKATIGEVIAESTALVGDVWNVTSAFSLGGKPYPAGTNVVCVEAVNEDNAESKWDALGGTVDLTPYATTEAMNTALAKKSDKGHTHISSEITDLANNTVSSIDGKVGVVTLDKAAGTAGDGKVVFSTEGNMIKATVDLSSKANTKHEHVMADITDLQAALDLKANTTDFVAITAEEMTGAGFAGLV